MKSKREIEDGLAQFYGTDQYHRLSPLHGKLVCTDGVAWLAEAAGAYWLIDAIASWQPTALKDPMLREIQFWRLKRDGAGARLACLRDSNDEAFAQEIEFTDFPLDEIELFACQCDPYIVLMLRTEY